MRIKLLCLCLLLASCATQKTASTNTADNIAAVLNAHTSPYKIFSVGYWPGGYMVLTLVDSNNKYFTLKTTTDTTLKVGLVYNAR